VVLLPVLQVYRQKHALDLRNIAIENKIAVLIGVIGEGIIVWHQKSNKITNHALLDQIAVSTNAIGKLRNTTIDYFPFEPLCIWCFTNLHTHILWV